MSKKTYSFEVITQHLAIEKDEVIEYIQEKIIRPYDDENLIFDEEDFGRLALICELKENCSPNIESLQVILHLIDQIHHLQRSQN